MFGSAVSDRVMASMSSLAKVSSSLGAMFARSCRIVLISAAAFSDFRPPAMRNTPLATWSRQRVISEIFMLKPVACTA
ncbi:hypothetical protein D3C72_2261220 [compost metagenome]